MRYLTKQALLPDSEEAIRRAEDAAQLLASKLRGLRVADLPISDYNKRYLGTYVAELDAVIQRYAFVLAWGLAPGEIAGKKPSVLLDYGGGSGMLSMLARAAGVPTVIYDDIFPVSCHDAAVVAEAVGLRADEYVAGEIDEAIAAVRARNLDVDVVANNDVIEHIYDMGAFLRRLPELSRGPMTVSLATGANTQNPRVRRKLERLQLEREKAGREHQWGHKQGDSLRSYLEIRADIVRERAPGLASADVERLAEATRGMMRKDIERVVDRFQRDGSLPVTTHPTNTCDPETGSWAEHLMDAGWLCGVLAEGGFRARAIPGPYGTRSHPAKRLVAAALDLAITGLKDRGLVLSPFLLLHGTTLPAITNGKARG